ncbi:hypothetical protein MMC13_004367 [Lambiella insularis]|nr:hypothetical protein [Lambiella insularis]
MFGFIKRRDSDNQDIPLCTTSGEHSAPAKARGLSPRPSIYDRYFQDSWWLEFLSWLAATVMLLALLVLLAKFNGKSLSEWHSNLSLNTIIAVVSQLVQAVLIVPIGSCLSQLQWLWYRNKKPLKDFSYFGDASSGLWGSLVLLYKRYASLIVWLGVVCMILQALIGAFAQQALSIPVRVIPIPANGSISRSLTYTTPLGIEQIGSVGPREVVPEMKLAIFTGLLRDNVNPSEVPGNSVTGNCTFGTFAFMGVCASVEDVTSSIVAYCKDTEHVSGISDGKCSYSVPALRNNHPFSNVRTRPGEAFHSTLYIGASMIYVDDGSENFPGTPINDTLIEFYIIYVPDLTILPTTTSQTSRTNYTGKLAALKGTLSLCAYIYNSSMQFGVTNTTVQAQETHLPWQHGVAANDNNQAGYSSSVPGTNDTLFMNPASMNGLSVWLITSTFNGTAYMPPPAPAPTTDPTGTTTITNDSPALFGTLASKQIATHLYGNETGVRATDGVQAMSALLANVATSMSNALRTTSTTPGTQPGLSSTTDVYFRVTWAWLVVPVLSIPLTLLFFALTAARSARHNVPAWKANRLAVLRALSPGVRARLGEGMARNSEMEGALRREGVEVRLMRGEGGWELRKG